MVEIFQLNLDSHPYIQTLTQLPLLKDPRIYDNKNLLALACLRHNLEVAVRTRPTPSLEHRMTGFTPSQLKFLEQNGIREEKEILVSEWEALKGKSPWNKVFKYTLNNESHDDDEYASWRITEMAPNFPNKRRFQLVCVQTNPDFGIWCPEINHNTEFKIGLVTKKELEQLMEEVGGN